MKPRHNRSLTLLELLIAIAIFSLMLIGFSSIDIFSRYHVITSDRRAKLQNDASYVLEHMTKNITGTATRGGAIGDINNYPIQSTNISGNSGISVWVDTNRNGKLDLDGSDKQIAYTYNSANYEIRYYSDYSGSPAASEILSSKITAFTPTYSSSNDYVEVELFACWYPDGSPVACGTPDNPCLSMKNRIYMPAVSTH